METELWFNKVGNTGVPVAPRDNTMVNTKTFVDADKNISITNEEMPVSPRTESIVCNKCNGGEPISNMFDVKFRPDGQYVCPDDWTMDKDPCAVKMPMSNGSDMNEASMMPSNGVSSDVMTYLPYVGIAVLGYFLIK